MNERECRRIVAEQKDAECAIDGCAEQDIVYRGQLADEFMLATLGPLKGERG